MAEDVPPPIDFWTALDEAQTTVETWPEWQRRVEADVYYEGDAPETSRHLSSERV